MGLRISQQAVEDCFDKTRGQGNQYNILANLLPFIAGVLWQLSQESLIQ